jgi:hypothetical protein
LAEAFLFCFLIGSFASHATLLALRHEPSVLADREKSGSFASSILFQHMYLGRGIVLGGKWRWIVLTAHTAWKVPEKTWISASWRRYAREEWHA